MFFGDIFGRPGREGLSKILPKLRKKFRPDLVIANCENIAHGRGITRKTIVELQSAGVDVFTSGNHVWRTKEAGEILNDDSVSVLRPANYPSGLSGKGVLCLTAGRRHVILINLLGRVFMRENTDCPFRAIDKILKKYARKAGIIIVDFHAEASSEKRAFGWYVDGRVSAVVGTHTHVPTADLQILPKGTAYITDVGMTGAYQSVIGADSGLVIGHLLTQLPLKLEVAAGALIEVNCLFLEIDDRRGKTKKVELIREFVKI